MEFNLSAKFLMTVQVAFNNQKFSSHSDSVDYLQYLNYIYPLSVFFMSFFPLYF